MIVLRQKNTNKIDQIMIKRITSKLDQDKVLDYEVSDKIPKDVISIYPDLNEVKIYVPEELDYAQYEIDDFMRVLARFVKVNVDFDKKFYIITLSGTLQFNQLIKLIEFIIEKEEFCTILTNKE